MVLTSEMGMRSTAGTRDRLHVATKPREVTGTPLFQPQPKKSPQAGAVLCACALSNFLLPLPRKIRIRSLQEIALGALSFCLDSSQAPPKYVWQPRSLPSFQHLPQMTRLSSLAIFRVRGQWVLTCLTLSHFLQLQSS